MKGCDLYRIETKAPMVSEVTQTETSSTKTVAQSGWLYATIYFDFDKSNIRAGEEKKSKKPRKRSKNIIPKK